MDIPGLGITQEIERILINWLFGSSEQFSAWLDTKTQLLNSVPWLNSIFFNLLGGFPFVLALLMQIGAVSFVFLLVYGVVWLFKALKPIPQTAEAAPLDDTERVRRKRSRRRRFR